MIKKREEEKRRELRKEFWPMMLFIVTPKLRKRRKLEERRRKQQNKTKQNKTKQNKKNYSRVAGTSFQMWSNIVWKSTELFDLSRKLDSGEFNPAINENIPHIDFIHSEEIASEYQMECSGLQNSFSQIIC